MPIHRAMTNGKAGFQYGQHGKIYTGPGARERAARQAAAIHASGFKEPAMSRTYGKKK